MATEQEQIADEIAACAPGGKAKFVITLAVIFTALIVGFVEYFGARCAHEIDPWRAKNPTPRDRRRLARVLRKLAAREAETREAELTAEGISHRQIDEVVDEAHAAILAYGQTVTEDRLAAIRAMPVAVGGGVDLGEDDEDGDVNSNADAAADPKDDPYWGSETVG